MAGLAGVGYAAITGVTVIAAVLPGMVDAKGSLNRNEICKDDWVKATTTTNNNENSENNINNGYNASNGHQQRNSYSDIKFLVHGP